MASLGTKTRAFGSNAGYTVSYEMGSSPFISNISNPVHQGAGPTGEDFSNEGDQGGSANFSHEGGQDGSEKIESSGKRGTVRGSSEDSV